MRLADFIVENLEQILQEWEEFAKAISPSTERMGSVELRDHAAEMLHAVASDLRTPQTPEQQTAKPWGAVLKGKTFTAAETHGIARQISGFTIEQMISEYRALRSSVLRLWSQPCNTGSEFELNDITRFNEAIDQAIAESVVRFAGATRESQDIFLGVLGHDLRTPLGVISLSAEVLMHSNDLSERSKEAVSRISRSVDRATSIMDSLLDFTRSHFGGGFPIMKDQASLTRTCEAIVDEVRAHHPGRSIILEADRDVVGKFDAARMEQVFCNLIENAVQHGKEEGRVAVRLHSEPAHHVVTVHNEGEEIAESDLRELFNPMKRARDGAGDHARRNSQGLGLGLYIAHEIVVAHGGCIEVSSTAAEGTTFRVVLPRTEE